MVHTPSNRTERTDATAQRRGRRVTVIRRHIEDGAAGYQRRRHLWRLMVMDGQAPAAAAALSDGEVIDWLERALARERRRARRGGEGYDLNRHLGLLQAITAERRRARQRRCGRPPPER